MSERGLPPEGAPACPFVAFEDDRDGRATAPDHRHRCFAEARPAPRALAHQEAYCLSSAFPVCPTFQDWARREAAAARPAATGRDLSRDEPPASRPLPPVEPEPRRVADTTPPVVPSRRPPQRDWAAPPPWAGEDGPGGAPLAAAGLAGAAAGTAAFDDEPGDDRYAPPRDDERYAPPRGDERYAPQRDPAPAPVHSPAPVPAPAAARGPDPYPSEARGLAGSAAHRLAGPDPDEPLPARPAGTPPTDDLDDWAAGAAGAAVAGSAAASRATPPPRRYEPARPDDRPLDRGTPGRGEPAPRKPVEQDPNELFGPAWERPRRYEAYPTLRTRMGIPAVGGLPKMAIWALILAVAALFLFLFGPGLLGLGKDSGGSTGASATPTTSEQVTARPSPTAPAARTPQVYVVAKGDTMSKIAKKFGVTVEQIMTANPQIKNPNKIKIGDQVTIPAPVQGGASSGANGAVQNGGSAAP